jgi:NAD-dependent dihydropyrimidine dehydrogenase PreA subunit
VRPGKCPACGKRIDPEVAPKAGDTSLQIAAQTAVAQPHRTPPRSSDSRDVPNPEAGSLTARHQVLAECHVVPEAVNCVQCGTCTHNCPMRVAKFEDEIRSR